MEADIDFKRLQYADLVQLGQLAAEALALSEQYDRSRIRMYCNIVAACNVEMLLRRREADRLLGAALN